ncbi:2-methylcitrate dehydratase [Serratia entomophila]|uniref:MmgE/PrpD family protein n=1 Tax=Serratia entomophila TaxID=42906 RepID=UPI00217864AE|nr:MmgE/PrpD family protein [Serratia entomophila]CAI0809184.1 2-methylcitrate dehydratase [Serratia entomophila]CAI1541596.1 2-methylcitrate dehydratase [Serratia entomophila]CAI1644631.1 2-methylcitrate dehydratase [Serratia entomophila]CAI1819129.1 2-methylcitrate dehydratase [Serratia entomophila]CAI2010970.1 2-methylcitrate dehydratase [Serratia entomophila]
MSLSITAQFAHQILNSRPDETALSAARRGVKDYFACALPIARGALSDAGLAAIGKVFPPNGSENRALRYGYVSHSLDFDDYHPALRGHPSTVVLSALLALYGDGDNVTELLAAYVIGVEAAGRLGLAAGTQHYALGFHSTATLGAVAACAAVARYLQLGQRQTQIALGLAATQAAGLRSQFGSAAKPLHAGLAARSAVNAALLAQAGFIGQPEGVLDNLLSSHGDGLQQPQRLTAGWGAPWRILQPGLEFKRYPTCGGTHSAAEAAFALRARLLEQGDALEEIARVEVGFPPGADTAPYIRRPTTGVEARFSLEYVIADALYNGEVPLTHYGEQPVDAAIAALAAKVERHADPTAPPDALDPELRFHRLTLTLQDGRQLSDMVTRKQTAARPTDLDAKLRAILQLLPGLDGESVIRDCALRSPGALPRLIALLN